MVRAYPVKFEALFKERIWGSERLGRLFGKELPGGVKIGESWELADLPEDTSTIVNGPLAGMNVRAFLEEFLAHYLFVENRTGWFPREDILKLIISLYSLSNRYGCIFRVSSEGRSGVIEKKKQVFGKIADLAGSLPDGR